MPAKCADCGLLQILHYKTREFVGVEPIVRETGEIKHEHTRYGREPLYEYDIACLAGIPIREEMKAVSGGVGRKQHFLGVIHRERTSCDDIFVTNVPGMTPKDHREMKLLQAVEARAEQHRREDLARQATWRQEDSEWREATEIALRGQHRAIYLLKGLEIIGVITASRRAKAT